MSTAFTRLAQALASQKQPEKIERFLLELLTPGEAHDVGLRWELVELLVAGVSQRQISARLGISLCKITRGAKILKKRNGAVAELLSAAGVKPGRAVVSAPKPSASKKAAPKTAAPTRGAFRKVEQKKTAPKKAAPKTAAPGKTAARTSAAKASKKVGDRHGTRISGKSKNQVRR